MKIPKIGQGTGHKGENFENFQDEFPNLVDTIKIGIENGLNLIDTAEVYAGGRSELIVGAAVRGIRDQVKIATKFAPNHHRRLDVFQSLEGSLKRLESDYIDLYQIHWPNSTVSLEETLGAMWDLQDHGKILEVGLSNFSLAQLRHAISIASLESKRIYSLQIKFNLIDRFAYSQIKELCESNGINIIAYSPIRNLLNQKNIKIDVLNKIAQSVDATPFQIALKWIISHPNVTAIPESSRIEHIIDMAKSQELLLDDAQKEELDSLYTSEVTEMQVRKISSRHPQRKIVWSKRCKEEILLFSNDFCPSIEELSYEIGEDNFLQPILVRLIQNSFIEYEIIEGELRYWAFILRFGADSMIPTLIIE
jgi:diketogulonate reductase-like aldo/keto reductase